MMDDGFMKMLCDDICITFKTFGTKHGKMYSAARANSQGRQQTYNTCAYESDNEDNENIFDDYSTPCNLATSPRFPLALMTPMPTDLPSHFGEVFYNNALRQITDLSTILHNPSILEEYSSNVPLPPLNIPILRRNSKSFLTVETDTVNDTFLPDDELINYIQTDTTTTCYATPSALHTMTQLSQPN
jgi:hypothetical protein